MLQDSYNKEFRKKYMIIIFVSILTLLLGYIFMTLGMKQASSWQVFIAIEKLFLEQ